MIKIVQLTKGFIDYDKDPERKGSYGPSDKGREALFKVYLNGKDEPIRVRFFISMLESVANTTIGMDEDKLFNDAKNILQGFKNKKFREKSLLYLYNFSTRDFFY